MGLDSAARDARAGHAGHLRRDALNTSPYGPWFANGATVFPRLLFMVQSQASGPLGLVAGRRAVRSARSSTEKAPWKNLPALEGVVEAEFVRALLLGENVLPYRVLPARDAVLPIEGTALLDGEHPHLELYPGLAAWWHAAKRPTAAVTGSPCSSSSTSGASSQCSYRRRSCASSTARQECTYPLPSSMTPAR
jgi:hypothetical protein